MSQEKRIEELLEEKVDGISRVVLRGKPVIEWFEHFRVAVPSDATVFHIKSCLTELSEKSQEIDVLVSETKFLLDSASTQIKLGMASEIEDKLTTAKEKGEKLTREGAKRMVEQENKRRREFLALAEAQYNLFRSIQDRLHKVYNVIHTMNITEGYIQKLDR